MKLTAKLVSVFLLGVFVFAGLRIYLAILHEEREFETEMAAEAKHIGRAMEKIITILWSEQGSEGAIQLIQKTSEGEARFSLRWVYFDAPRDDPHCPTVPKEVVRAILSHQRPLFHTPGPDGVMYAHTYWPVSVNDPRRGGLEFSKDVTELRRNKVDAVVRNAWIAAVMAGLCVVLVAVAGVRLVGRPIELLVEKTRRIAAGDLSGPVHLQSRDELSELADSINDMCTRLTESQERIREETAARIKAIDQLRHTDRLRTVGRFAAGIAHELGTPLNVVSGRAGLIASGKLSEGEIVQSAGTIKSEADRMTAIIRQLLDFARRRTPQRNSIDLRQVVDETVDLLASLAEKRNVNLVVKAGDARRTVFVDRGQVQQVLTNLIMNAVQAMPEGGEAEIVLDSVRATPPAGPEAGEGQGSSTGEGEYVSLCVRDEGQGIEQENLDQVFEPFFTTKEVGEGTGLGLSIAYGIVLEHGGWIDVASEPGRGTCFTVYLPKESDS